MKLEVGNKGEVQEASPPSDIDSQSFSSVFVRFLLFSSVFICFYLFANREGREGKDEASKSRGSNSSSSSSSQLTTMEPELYNQLRGLQKSARELRQVIFEVIKV